MGWEIMEEEVNKLRISLQLAGLVLSNKDCDKILMVQASLKEMGEKFDLKTASKIYTIIQEKYMQPQIHRFKIR